LVLHSLLAFSLSLSHCLAIDSNLGLTEKKSSLSSKLLNMASLSLSLPLRGKSLMDIESPKPSPTKPSAAQAAFQQSNLGRISNVEEVINVLKSDEEEYLQLIKVLCLSLSVSLSLCSLRRRKRRN
jgi:hypothetical protein